MQKTFRASWIFLPLALICGVLYIRTLEESLLLGLLYGAVLSIKLPKQMAVRDLYPFGMLFLFLMVLVMSPTRLFTISLIYTTRALIVFRGMIIALTAIQNSKTNSHKSEISSIIGLAFEFFLSAIFVYSTFRPVAVELITFGHFALGGVLMLLASAFAPYWIPGVILAALSFSPITRAWGIIGFGILAVYESNFSPRARSATPRILP